MLKDKHQFNFLPNDMADAKTLTYKAQIRSCSCVNNFRLLRQDQKLSLLG